jgi:hypothetical protein
MLLQERIQRGEGHSQVVLKQEKGYDVPLANGRAGASRFQGPEMSERHDAQATRKRAIGDKYRLASK